MKRVYISGPMSGLPNHNFPAFYAAADLLRVAGFDPVNPAELNPDTGREWHEYLRTDLKALCDCDMLALLPGWERSEGAHLEVHVAHRLRIEISTVEDLLRRAARS